MFEDIAQMEQEIETFRKNIVASSELVEGIFQLAEAARQQNETISTTADTLAKKVDSCVEQIKESHVATLRTLSDENEGLIKALQENLSSEQASRMEELEQIKKDLVNMQASYEESYVATLRTLSDENEASVKALQESLSSEQASRMAELEQIKNELVNMQASYAEKLKQTELTIQDYQRNAEQQYNDFVHRLETTNVDQFFIQVQELKQSMKTKFLLLLSGVGITLIVTVLNLILN